TRPALALFLTLLLLSLCACGNRETAAPTPAASPSTAPPSVAGRTPAAPAAPPGQPVGGSGVGPIPSHGAVIDPQANSQQAAGAAGSIDFDVPKGWESQKVSSNMRLVQTSIPGPGGPGEFGVFYFGP